ncbi:polysaccharide lyase family protein [Micromonospora sp. DR5-3]|uniref:COG1470 family protein n=1 Tax=unclassified Micromonospora TaxID=2617518 RepID=UPI0011D6A884|nr:MULTISPECIES: putative Ig domain-containing protein [unclassified Micromonospora]MCW3816021.1 polysaccharide lyase family protein [Micromonospora sp. DR5-3]TYC20351.1 hypothetical protein FXF52_31875 [Micromonospora sp. MP36]
MIRFRRVAALAFAAVAGAAAVGAAPPAAQASPRLEIDAGFLSVGLSETGRVTSLVDVRSGFDYVAAGKSVPLVSVVADGQQAVPTEVAYSSRDKVFTFRTNKASIDVKVVQLATYSTLEVVGLDPAPGVDVQTLLWGPLPTSVTQTIGETAGVVRNDAFAVGLRPLNDKTVGGWPNEHLAYGFGPDLIWNPYRLQTGDRDDWLASNVAAKTTWGSVLRAATYDYSKVRTRQRTNGYEIPLGPLPAPEGRIIGSKVALFGSAPDLALSVLSQIAKEQGLPYPTLKGQWQKAAQRTSQSHFWIHDLNTSNVTAASRYAKQAGINNIYAIAGNGPWVSHGHYQFNSAFGGSDENAAKLVATAANDGIEVGVHTLSDFIDVSDPYVRAPADPRLAVGGRVKLTRPLAASDTTLYVDADRPLGPGLDGKRLRIGDEFIAYNTVTKVSDTEWQVSGLGRGQWGSAAKSYPTGTSAALVNVNGYGGAIGDLPIIDEIATRLATAYNSSGVRATSYDGLESAGYTGWGGYGFARLVNGVYRQLDATDGFITECSNLSSNTWDAQSRASWGEIGPTDYAQIIRSNIFYRANYLPGMMGQQGLSGNSSLQTIERTMARAASLDAGVNFETSVGSLASGANTTAVLQAVKLWESARNHGAFTVEQKKLLGDANTYWHLSEVARDREWSLQQVDSVGEAVGAAQPVRAPVPGFTTPKPPDAQLGRLYEFKVSSSTPQTVRYEVTSGALPAGLSLNPDTGAITGVPSAEGSREFTITARNDGGVADASVAYKMKVTPFLAPPEITLTAAVGQGKLARGESVDVSVSLRNDSPQSVSGVLSLTGPDSISVDPSSVEFAGLESGKTLTRTLRVSAGPDAGLGGVVLTASGRVTGRPVAPVQVPLTVVNPVDVAVGSAGLDLVAGQAAPVTVTVSSNLPDTVTTMVGVQVPSGWTAGEPEQVTLGAGESKSVTLSVTPAADAFGKATVTVAAKGEFATVASSVPAVVSKPVAMVGRADISTREFALSPDGYAAYPSTFPDDVAFTAGVGDPATGWSYIQPGPADGWAGGRSHTFRLTVNLAAAPAADLTLTAWLYDSHDAAPPALQVGLNGTSVGTVQTPAGAGRGHRWADGIKPSTVNVTLPAANLKAGDNTITLTTTSGSWMVYDAIGVRQLP